MKAEVRPPHGQGSVAWQPNITNRRAVRTPMIRERFAGRARVRTFDDRGYQGTLTMISADPACGNESIALQHLLCHYVRPSLGIPRGTADAIMLQATRLDASDVEALFAKHATALCSSDAGDDAVGAVAALGRRLALPCRPAPLGLNNAICVRSANTW